MSTLTNWITLTALTTLTLTTLTLTDKVTYRAVLDSSIASIAFE